MFSHRISRRGLVVGAAALVLGSAAVGVASSQQATTVAAQTGNQQDGQNHKQRHQQYFDAVASNLGISTDRLRQAFQNARQSLANNNQRPTRDQFKASVANELNVSTDRLNQAFEAARQQLGLPERRAGSPGFRGGPNAAAFAERQQKLLETVADKLNVQVDDLKQAMADARPRRGEGNGQRPNRQQILTDVANKLNVSTDDLTKAFQEARQELGFPEHKPGGRGFRRGPQPNN